MSRISQAGTESEEQRHVAVSGLACTEKLFHGHGNRCRAGVAAFDDVSGHSDGVGQAQRSHERVGDATVGLVWNERIEVAGCNSSSVQCVAAGLLQKCYRPAKYGLAIHSNIGPFTAFAGNLGRSNLGEVLYRPRRSVPNSEIVDRIDSSDEWIRTRSGIAARGWAEPDETIVTMSVSAARSALAAAGIAAEQIDAVVLATSSQMVLGPSAGAVVATELGLHDTAAFDVSAGCAGFCYALGNAAALVRAGQARHVLVIGVERLSDLLDPTDRTCAFIFADGAGAVVVGPSESEEIGPVATQLKRKYVHFRCQRTQQVSTWSSAGGTPAVNTSETRTGGG